MPSTPVPQACSIISPGQVDLQLQAVGLRRLLEQPPELARGQRQMIAATGKQPALFRRNAGVTLPRPRLPPLSKQVDDLRGLVFPSTVPGGIPLIAMEADAVMSGKTEQIILSDEELKQREDEMLEADRLFAGTYE